MFVSAYDPFRVITVTTRALDSLTGAAVLTLTMHACAAELVPIPDTFSVRA